MPGSSPVKQLRLQSHKLFYIPMVFMLVVTICSLIQTIIAKFKAADTWSIIQAVPAIVLVVLAVDLAITAFNTLKNSTASNRRRIQKTVPQ